ncbi:MAG TPA: CPBP family glutamic-type intramembrane protease [Kribbella sp.]|jgi:membrane protease YdiL (CAAX protease family)
MIRQAWARAALGAIVMAIALGTASALGSALDAAPTVIARLIPALLCASIAVLLVKLLHRGSMTSLGLTGGIGPFLLGIAVTGGSAALLFGLATIADWLAWGPFDLPAVLLFLLTNGVVALLLEALPEELTLRGYTWTALRSSHSGTVAALGTTGLFLLVPGGASVVQAGVGALAGSPAPSPGLAPPGEDPASYLFLLTVFGLTLVAARAATGSLWTSIATHLTFLTVNRLTLYGDQRGAGWSVELVQPDAILLVPAYLLLTALIYRFAIRRTARYFFRTSTGSRSIA